MSARKSGAGSETAVAPLGDDRLEAAAVASLGHRIRQRRGRKTYERLMETAFELLERDDLETITIARLARSAGYSVGAFYARFRSKDEFFAAMLAEHIAERMLIRNRLFRTLADDELVHALIVDLVTSYWRRRRFWRAALIRGVRDPALWTPVRRLGQAFADALVSRITERIRRPLTSAEEGNVRFAFQVARGAINNAIINRPGPVMGRAAFIDNLERAFRVISGYDRLMGLDERRAEPTRFPAER